ncbi:MAG: ATP-binding protein, partial [Rhodococcus sp.]|nr:ATP-binding protein [Rhodococcus sp. (in: high G+C Gram-positive bacteria)]
QASERLRHRIGAFDATSGYESASLDAEHVHGTRWARAAKGALDRSADRTSRSCLMFFGPTGIGKTWAGFAICNAAAGRFGADSVRFATEETLLGGDVAPWELRSRLQRWLRGAAAVLIDDIGVANRRTDQVQAAWKELCSQIAAHPEELIVVGTTNRQGWNGDAGLTSWMGAQSTSRLQQWSVDCSTGWTDRRTGVVHERWREHLEGGPER